MSSEHKLKENYPLTIKLHYVHNHNIQCAEAERFKKLDRSVVELVYQLLDDDLAPSAVY